MSEGHSAPSTETQVLIIPATSTFQFQQGYLGADNERAAIEGELQIKGADGDRWRKVSVELFDLFWFAFHSLKPMSLLFPLSKDDVTADDGEHATTFYRARSFGGRPVRCGDGDGS